MDNKNLTFAQAMKKLEEINDWFQHEDIDLDKGLVKLQEAKEIIKICRQKLKTVENEFIRIKEEYEEVESADAGNRTTVIETHEETIITANTDEIAF